MGAEERLVTRGFADRFVGEKVGRSRRGRTQSRKFGILLDYVSFLIRLELDGGILAFGVGDTMAGNRGIFLEV